MLKIRQLVARPIQSVDLSFPVAGHIRSVNDLQAQLGKRLSSPDTLAVDTLLTNHNDTPPFSGAASLHQAVATHYFFKLECGTQEHELERSRQKATQYFLEKIKPKAKIHRAFSEFYLDGNGMLGAGSLAKRLLRSEGARFKLLDDAYTKDRVSVARGTVQSILSRPTRTMVPKHTSLHVNPYDHNTRVDYKYSDSYTQQQVWHSVRKKWITMRSGTPRYELQKLVTKEPTYRAPKKESEIESLRLQLQVRRQLLQDDLVAAHVPDLPNMWRTEMDALIADLRRAQSRYLGCFLVSPVEGLVTAINKDHGEHCAAGEAVLRIENDSELYLVGRVQSKSALSVGTQVEIESSDLFDSGQQQLKIVASLAAVRGHEADDDEWEVILRCPNPMDNGRYVVPLNYSFDIHSTVLNLA